MMVGEILISPVRFRQGDTINYRVKSREGKGYSAMEKE